MVEKRGGGDCRGLGSESLELSVELWRYGVDRDRAARPAPLLIGFRRATFGILARCGALIFRVELQ